MSNHDYRSSFNAMPVMDERNPMIAPSFEILVALYCHGYSQFSFKRVKYSSKCQIFFACGKTS